VSRYEDITNGIWSDPDFDDLSLEAAMLYLWSWTNPRCGMAGIYKVSQRAMLESKVPVNKLAEALSELAASRFAFYEDGVLWVRSRVKHLRSKSPMIAKSIARDLDQVGDSVLRRAFLDEYGDLGWISGALERFSRPSREGLAKTGSQAKTGDPLQRVGGPPQGGPTSGSGSGQEENNGPSRTREAGSEFDDAQARLKADELPDDLPPRLHDPARQVQQRLLRLHDRKPGSLRPALGAIGRVLASMPDRPHVDVADDVEHYWSFGGGQEVRRVDLVATYRNRLKTAPVVTGGPSPGTGIDDIVERAERRERLLEQQRREREATGARS
jgi:hypothetical protein